MEDVWLLGLVLSVVAVNMTMLGIMFKMQVSNGKPKRTNGNPHPVDPDDIRLGDVSIAWFKTEFVEPIIAAIEGQK